MLNPDVYDTYGNVLNTKRELRDSNGAFLRWVKTESTYDLNSPNPDQPTSVTQYLENGHAVTTKMTYDGDGNVLSVVDPLGHKTALTYTNGRVATVQDQRAITKGYFTVQNQYDPKGNLLSSKDALNHSTYFTYFPDGRPHTVTDAQGHQTTFALDAAGHIASVTDATGHATKFEYNANGNKTKTITTRTVGWGADASVETLTSQVIYDDGDRPVGAIAPDGVRSAIVYNALGQVDHSTQAMGTLVERTTSYLYNDLGQRVKTVLPDGGFTTTNYDEAGQVSSSFDRIGRGSLSDYDSLGRLVHSYQVKPGSGSIQSRLVLDAQGNPLSGETQYDDLGRVAASRDARGYWSYSRYDDEGNALESEDALHHVSKTDYDELNRAWRTTDAKTRATTTTYDNAGRATRTTFADGTYTETTYDELNRAVRTRDQSGHIRRVHYDVLGRMDWVEVPLDQANNKYLRTRFGYNELGQKTWQQDAKGVATDRANGLDVDFDAPISRVTRFVYDKRGRVIARQLPGSFNGVQLNEAMEYNEIGQLKRKRDFRGFWTDFEYDERGRMVGKYPSAALGEMPVRYEYPDEFTVISRRGLVSTKQKYNAERGWLDTVEAPHGTLNFDHNVYGQMTQMNVVSGGTTRTTGYGYDELSRLKKITSFNGGEWNYGYDEVGNKQSLTRPNGVTTNYGYDTLNRLTDLANVKGSGTSAQEVSRFNYHLRADGRRDGLNEWIVQPNGTSVTRAIQYSFDDANRLVGEAGTDGSGKSYSKSYTLDEAGNRRQLIASHEVSGTTTTNYSYNDLDWMTQQSVVAPNSTTTTNYDYDANGSQTGIMTQVGAAAPSYVKQVWDFEGHLTARGAVDASGNWGNARNEYSYDADGIRLSQSTVAQSGITSAKTNYLWNGNQLLEERDKDNVLLARYEHGQELGPLSMLRPATSTIAAQTRLFIGDGQDSTRQLLDENGAIKDSYFYDSFGVDLNGGQQTSANSFKYTGQQQDGSGLYYLRARYYETGSGRFLSHDPVMGGDDPITMHRYLYANVDPINVVDPSGEFGDYSMSSVTSGMAIGATLGGIGGGLYGHFAQGHTGFALLRDIMGGAALGGLGGAAYPLLGSAIALNTAFLPAAVSQGLAFWGATAGSGALTAAVSAAFDGGSLRDVGYAAGTGAVTSIALGGIFKGGLWGARLMGSRTGIVPFAGSWQRQSLDNILTRATTIAHDPAFLKGTKLHSEELQNTFFDLFEDMAKNARYTKGGGFAGAVKSSDDTVVLALGFGKNLWGGQPSDTTIRHELSHVALDAIHRVRTGGESLFMVEANLKGHDPAMLGLWAREEGFAWFRSIFTTGGARS